MGVRSVIGNPVEVVWEAINDRNEVMRRHLARRRMRLYRDDAAEIMRAELQRVVSDRERRRRIEQFAWLGSAISLFKRITNEIAAPVYAVAPTRTIDGKEHQPAFDLVTKECRYNRKADFACRVAHAGNTAWTMHRYSKRLGVIKDVITPDCATVIPDPDDPTRMLGFAYDKPVNVGGRIEMHRVFWDDEEAFELNEKGAIVAIADKNGAPASRLVVGNGHPGILPVVDIHVYERSGEYYDTTSGSDLEAGAEAVHFVGMNMLRLVHTQGHTQLGVNGDPGSFPRNQTSDQENPIFAGEGNTLTAITNPTSPENHIKVAEHIALSVAANWGVNRDRMNHKVSTDADMVGLLERRQDAIKVMADVELREFEVLKVVSQQHADPAKRIPDEARLKSCDFAEISHKVERSKLLELWQSEIDMNLRNHLDCIRQDNPEIRSDEEAFAEIVNNARVRAKVIELMRSLNIHTDANAENPGQSPQANGAMGQKVRDGEMSKDEAADQAKAGTPAK
jgi:hypothetical protein